MKLIYIFLLACLGGCAAIKAPEGGPRDNTGPLLLRVTPAHLSTQTRQPHVVFRFNEYLDRNSVQSAVFISPIPAVPPRIWAKNRQLHVQFMAPVPDSTTCVISVGTGLRDFNEKNPIEEGFSYAFSSGSHIDTGMVRGHLVSAFTGKPVSRMRALLFPEDSVQGGYFGRMPLYAADADSGGHFTLAYLRPGRYRLLAVGDKDNSYSWNQPTETIGARQDNDLLIDARNTGWEADLITWVPDDQPPRLLAALPLHKYALTLRFSEPLAQAPVVLIGTDTLPAQWAPEGKAELVRLNLPHALDTTALPLQLRAVTDTAGNRMDTLAVLQPEPWAPNPRLRQPAPIISYIPPVTAFRPLGLVFLCRDALASAQDTADAIAVTTLEDNPVPFRYQKLGSHSFAVELRYPYSDSIRITLKPGLRLAFDRQLDTTLVFTCLPENPDRYGSFQMELVARRAPLILELLDSRQQVVRRERVTQAGVHPFGWTWLRPGDYSLRVISDEDHSGAWTPGRLIPWRRPEPVVYYPDRISLRASWEMEGLRIEYPPHR
ncbi:MAG: Ig-like domain-containing protein [Bacteroidetes bacterium]|nr:Ig-like domain-containing protein [Bacteroidota bacterium]